MSDKMMTITIWLCGRSYRIKIKQDDESVVRKAVKVAEEKIAEIKNFYAGKDEQDFIAMCLLMYATDSAIAANNDPLVNDQLNKMSAKIEKALS